MSVKQYIGARYVPRFLGTWNNTTQYEALDVVDNGSGTSYIARKTVPAGTPLNDTDFWFVYGASSGAILNLQTRMDAAENEIIELNNESENGTIIFAGDSYGSDATGGWISKLVSIMGLSSNQYYDAHSDGASFSAGTYLSRLTAVVNAMSADEKTNVKKLIVLGGINDSGSPTEAVLDPAFSSYAAFVYANLPYCTVYVGFIGNFVANSAILHGRDGIVECQKLYEELSGKYGFKFIGNMEYILHNYTYMAADGIHPTSEGAEMIARYANVGIKSGGVDVKYMEYFDRDHVTDAFDFTGVQSGWSCNILAPAFATNYDVFTLIDNGLMYMQCRVRFNLSPDSATTIPQGTQIVMGKINTKLFSGRPILIIPIDCEAKLADNSFLPLKAHLIFNSGNMYLRVDQLGDNWGVQTNSVAQILINPFTATLPTMYC